MDKPTGPIEYGEIQISRHLGRGIVVDEAPEHAKVYIGIIARAELGVSLDDGALRIADQVLYEITGYDPADCMLALHLACDWRPGQKDGPALTNDLDITDYLYVHRYRTDHGDWAWSWRCSGAGNCNGHLALSLSSRDEAERNAREHLAAEHPAKLTAPQEAPC